MTDTLSARKNLIALCDELKEEGQAAFDMWTWLPSYHSAVKAHGDYATVHLPPIVDIIKEASKVFAYQSRVREGNFEANEDVIKYWFACPCGCEVIDHAYKDSTVGTHQED